jgi:dephospho-CoA kinase
VDGERKRRVVVGITGGPGSGKTTAAEALAARGARVVSLDAVGHAQLEDPCVRDELRQQFGGAIFAPDGSVRRDALGRIAFGDPDALSALNLIMHPRMVRQVRAEVARFGAEEDDGNAACLVIEGALLIEMGLERLCDRVILLVAPAEVRRARLASARAWSDDELARRERVQLDETSRRALADVAIENTAGVDDLRSEMTRLWKEWT